MIRKLILSVVGALWSSQSCISIATALLLSVVFLILQFQYQPFKSKICNNIQQCCLSSLSLLYFGGLLLKVDAVEKSDQDAVGVLLVVVLVAVICAVVFAILQQTYTVVTAIRLARHCSSVLQKLPQQDPPNDTDEFYRIQIPCERSNMGEKFEPKLPHLLSHISEEQKLEVVRLLTTENEVRLSAFFERIQSDWMIPLERVKASSDVTNYGQICVKYNKKTDESILAKVIHAVFLLTLTGALSSSFFLGLSSFDPRRSPAIFCGTYQGHVQVQSCGI